MKKPYVVLSLVALMSLVGCGNQGGSSSPISKPSSPSVTETEDSSSPSVNADSSVISSEHESSLDSVSSEDSISSEESVSSESSESSVTPESSVIEEEHYEVTLPTEDGFDFSLDKESPLEGETVTLYVKNLSWMSKRLDALYLNGTLLTKKNTSEKNTFAYSFVMPSKMNAAITATIVDVYGVSTDVDTSAKIALTGIGDGLFAEGDVVTFKVAAYPGYCFSGIKAVEDDVTVRETSTNTYSFTMPAHAVTITATTSDEVYYKADFTGVDSHITIDHIANSLSVFQYGQEVKFSAVADSEYLDSFSLFANGDAINEVPGESGWYSFTMPSGGVKITSTVKINYRTISIVNSEHFDISLTTMVKDDQGVEQEVPVTNNNVMKGQAVKVTVTEKDNDEHLYMVKAIEVSHYYNSAYVSGSNKANATYNADDGTYSFTIGNDKYYEVKVVEKKDYLSGTTYAGNYKGYRPYYGAIQDIVINADGSGKIGSDSFNDFTMTNTTDAYYTLPYKATYSSYNYYAFFHDDMMFAFKKSYLSDNYITRGSAYLSVKGATTLDNNKFRSYYIAKDGSHPSEEWIFMEKPDGTPVGVYVNYGAMTVDFDYSYEVTKGTGIGSSDEVVMKKNGVAVKKLRLNKAAPSTDGYEVICTVVTTDGNEGTYTNGSDTLVLDGYGACTLNGESGTYAISDNKITITIDGVATEYNFNKADNSFSDVTPEPEPDPDTPTTREVTLTDSQLTVGDYRNWGTYNSGETVIFHMTAVETYTDLYFRGDYATIDVYDKNDRNIGSHTKTGTEDYHLYSDIYYGDELKIVVTFQEVENPTLKVKFEYYSDWGDEY